MQRRGLRDRQNATIDRVVVTCATSGQMLALVQAAGSAPARLVLETDEMLLHAAPNGISALCRCAARAHPLDVYRYQTEVYRQNGDPNARRPVHLSV